ncbi:hypothetical protein DFH07DRAFT_991053 [Mycena maculata]|uniref:Malate dehydrogenase n=1 Tax=Mycena maculata TaxID=230809 RepID=A0AAD7I1R5_9AGAR|nr:hypothetical protein DFH07DRAFT_991053 [Mycena maculata]
MFSFQLLVVLSSATTLACAAPTSRDSACDTSEAVMDLPTNQTALVSPSTAPLYVALGVGIQNYSCSSTTAAYSSIGAVASLFDLSCLDQTSGFANIQTTAFNLWSAAPASLVASSVGGQVGAPNLLGYHYFVIGPSGSLSPEWDFTSTGTNAGNSSAFVIGAKVGDIASPTAPSTDVDWLALNDVEGSLASKIFRIDTVGGQPPTSCVAGSADISVKYTAKYYLY